MAVNGDSNGYVEYQGAQASQISHLGRGGSHSSYIPRFSDTSLMNWLQRACQNLASLYTCKPPKTTHYQSPLHSRLKRPLFHAEMLVQTGPSRHLLFFSAHNNVKTVSDDEYPAAGFRGQIQMPKGAGNANRPASSEEGHQIQRTTHGNEDVLGGSGEWCG